MLTFDIWHVFFQVWCQLGSNPIDYKEIVIKYAKENSNNNSANKFKGDCKRVPEWAQNDSKLLPMKRSPCRIDGGGRKLIIEIKGTGIELDTRITC